MKALPLLAALSAAVALASAAAAKDVAVLVVVGADGRSLRLEPERAVLAVLFHHPASVYREVPRPAEPRGGYVRLYPLGPGGFPATPGRFYPTTGALCFGWDQARARSCGRLGRPRRLLAASTRLARFAEDATVLGGLGRGTINLVAAAALAFDRHAAAQPAARPARCLAFTARWTGRHATLRPPRVCISRRGVYARGRLYPTDRVIWQLARASARP